jgi:hypothetical protein
MIGEGAGPQIHADRRLAARQHALHAAVRLELGMAGDALQAGLTEVEALRARTVVVRTAARLEEWLLRDVESSAPRGYTVREYPPAPETEI